MKVELIHPVSGGRPGHPEENCLYGRGIHDLPEELVRYFLSEPNLIGIVRHYKAPERQEKLGTVTAQYSQQALERRGALPVKANPSPAAAPPTAPDPNSLASNPEIKALIDAAVADALAARDAQQAQATPPSEPPVDRYKEATVDGLKLAVRRSAEVGLSSS